MAAGGNGAGHDRTTGQPGQGNYTFAGLARLALGNVGNHDNVHALGQQVGHGFQGAYAALLDRILTVPAAGAADHVDTKQLQDTGIDFGVVAA